MKEYSENEVKHIAKKLKLYCLYKVTFRETNGFLIKEDENPEEDENPRISLYFLSNAEYLDGAPVYSDKTKKIMRNANLRYSWIVYSNSYDYDEEYKNYWLDFNDLSSIFKESISKIKIL